MVSCFVPAMCGWKSIQMALGDNIYRQFLLFCFWFKDRMQNYNGLEIVILYIIRDSVFTYIWQWYLKWVFYCLIQKNLASRYNTNCKIKSRSYPFDIMVKCVTSVLGLSNSSYVDNGLLNYRLIFGMFSNSSNMLQSLSSSSAM